MLRKTSTRRTRPARRWDGDAGFALIEVMVSAVLLIALATATLSLIEHSGAAAATTRSRAVATQLAQQDQDEMRLMALKNLSAYHVTHTPQTVGGINYTVESQAEWMRDDGKGKVVCDGSTSRVEYAKLTSSVTWTNHPTPVILESYVSPGVKGVSMGSLAVKLHGDGTKPTPGISIGFQGQTVATDENGCAVFTALTPGMSNATWTGATVLPNFVDKNGNPLVSKSVTIGAGQNSYLDVMFDRAGTIPARFVDDIGANVKWNTVSAAHSSMEVGVRVFGKVTDAKTTTEDATMLFPFVTPYSLYAGSCGGNAASTWDTSGSSSTLGQRIAPAGTTAAAVDVKVPDVAAQIRLTSTTGVVSSPQGKKVSFDVGGNAKMAGCTDRIGAGSADAPSTSATGEAAVTPLPWGQYTACTQFATGWIAKKTFYNTPGTTTGAEAQTRDSIALPSAYSAVAGKIAQVQFNVKATSATNYAANDPVGATNLTTVVSGSCPA